MIVLEREEIELFPAGLISCLLNNNEVRVLKISPKRLTFRISEETENINEIKVVFYIFCESRYEEVIIEDYNIVAIEKNDFYISYKLDINDEVYFNNVRRSFRDYSNYVRLRGYSDDNEFSKEMINYPAELDYDFYEYYSNQKYNCLSKLNFESYDTNITKSIELDPDDLKVYQNRGDAYCNLGNYDEAIKDFAVVSELEKNLK